MLKAFSSAAAGSLRLRAQPAGMLQRYQLRCTSFPGVAEAAQELFIPV
jgi:hypothetical protein